MSRNASASTGGLLGAVQGNMCMCALRVCVAGGTRVQLACLTPHKQPAVNPFINKTTCAAHTSPTVQRTTPPHKVKQHTYGPTHSPAVNGPARAVEDAAKHVTRHRRLEHLRGWGCGELGGTRRKEGTDVVLAVVGTWRTCVLPNCLTHPAPCYEETWCVVLPCASATSDAFSRHYVCFPQQAQLMPPSATRCCISLSFSLCTQLRPPPPPLPMPLPFLAACLSQHPNTHDPPTSPVNSSVVLRLSTPDVPSNTCTTARVPSTSSTCPRLMVPSPSRTSTISAYMGFCWRVCVECVRAWQCRNRKAAGAQANEQL